MLLESDSSSSRMPPLTGSNLGNNTWGDKCKSYSRMHTVPCRMHCNHRECNRSARTSFLQLSESHRGCHGGPPTDTAVLYPIETAPKRIQRLDSLSDFGTITNHGVIVVWFRHRRNVSSALRDLATLAAQSLQIRWRALHSSTMVFFFTSCNRKCSCACKKCSKMR